MTPDKKMTRKPLTDKELEVWELVGRGLRVEDVRAELAQRGRFVALSTLRGCIREIAHKIDNPHNLPPVALIRWAWSCTSRAA